MSHSPKRCASFNSAGDGELLSLIVLKPSERIHSKRLAFVLGHTGHEGAAADH